MNCVVPENSHTLPTEGNENSEGRGGGVQKVAISDGVGWLFEVFFRRLRVRLVVVVVFGFSTNSCPLSQNIRYFTVNWCFKTRILVFIVDPLITVGWMLFNGFRDCFFFNTFAIGSWRNFRISSDCFISLLWYSPSVVWSWCKPSSKTRFNWEEFTLFLVWM